MTTAEYQPRLLGPTSTQLQLHPTVPALSARGRVVVAAAPSAATPAAREHRVRVAVSLIWNLSMLDLGLTVAMTTTTGMFESNPFARLILTITGSAYALAAWKIASTGVCTLILFRLRRHWKAEAAAWLCVALLAGTTVIWLLYLQWAEAPPCDFGVSAGGNNPRSWMIGR